MARQRVLVLDRSDRLAGQVRRVTEGADVEVEHCARVGTVDSALAGSAGPTVVVAGPSLGTAAGLNHLTALRAAHPSLTVVLALAERPDSSLRDIVRVGAVDLLQLPATDAAVGEAVSRALELSAAARSVPAPAAAPGSEHGSVVTVTSATGGCGKTFFATNLAYYLNHELGRRVVVLDLDLQFGEMATALRLRPRYTIADVLEHDDTDTTVDEQIEDYLARHETGIHLLAAPRRPEEADGVTAAGVLRIIEALRQRFDHVIIDTPTALSEMVLSALDVTDVLYVLGTLDLPSIRNMSVFLSTVERLQVPSEQVRLVLNKAESDVGIDVGQVQRLFPKAFEAVLPYSKDVSRSINQGMPVLAASPDSEVSRRLARGLGRFGDEASETETRPDSEPRRRRSRARRASLA